MMSKAVQSVRKAYQLQRSLLAPRLTAYNLCKVGKMSQSTSTSEGVYELRTYSLYPHKMMDFMSFMKTNFGLRTKHSKLSAYFVTEIGGINEVVHLWFYDDLNHRASVRGKMAQSEEWKSKFLSKVTPMLQKMDNQLFTLHPNSPKPKFAPQSIVFDVHFLTMNGPPHQWEKESQEAFRALENISSDQSSSLIGIWKSEVGTGNTISIFWSHQSPNGVMELRSKLDKCDEYQNFLSKTSSSFSKMLTPSLTDLWS